MKLTNGHSNGVAHGAEVRHRAKVERVARDLRARPADRLLSLRKKAVSHVVPKRDDARHTDDKVDVSDLDEVLEIDVVGRMCTAEPGVTFVDLVRKTLAHGLVPIVVPELKTITIGGAVAGCSLESMSFQYGGFHDGCLEYEVVTTTGEIITATPSNEHALVFQMMHGSFGTLGILSKLRFRLVDAKPYVHVEYERHATLEDYRAAIWRHYQARDYDFMDGFIHSPTSYVLNLGRFVDRAPYTNRYDWMKVYYRSTAVRTDDYLETEQYFFRYDNGVTNVHPRSAIGRFFFGKFLHSSEVLRIAEKLRRVLLDAERPTIIVDLLLPFSGLDRFMSWYGAELAHFPLWVVPYRVMRRYEWIADGYLDGVEDELFVDLAIYGAPQRPGKNDYAELEKILWEVKGIKTLISYNYYDEDTFWKTWNRPNYLAAKSVCDPNNLLRDLYAKTCRASLGLAG